MEKQGETCMYDETRDLRGEWGEMEENNKKEEK